MRKGRRECLSFHDSIKGRKGQFNFESVLRGLIQEKFCNLFSFSITLDLRA